VAPHAEQAALDGAMRLADRSEYGWLRAIAVPTACDVLLECFSHSSESGFSSCASPALGRPCRVRSTMSGARSVRQDTADLRSADSFRGRQLCERPYTSETSDFLIAALSR
jgi:hypothetical protein